MRLHWMQDVVISSALILGGLILVVCAEPLARVSALPARVMSFLMGTRWIDRANYKANMYGFVFIGIALLVVGVAHLLSILGMLG